MVCGLKDRFKIMPAVTLRTHLQGLGKLPRARFHPRVYYNRLGLWRSFRPQRLFLTQA